MWSINIHTSAALAAACLEAITGWRFVLSDNPVGEFLPNLALSYNIVSGCLSAWISKADIYLEFFSNFHDLILYLFLIREDIKHVCATFIYYYLRHYQYLYALLMYLQYWLGGSLLVLPPFTYHILVYLFSPTGKLIYDISLGLR